MKFDPRLMGCEDYERCLSRELGGFACQTCELTRFVICPDCKSTGATSRDASHEWEAYDG